VEIILPLLARMSAAAAAETPSKRPKRVAAIPQPSISEISDSRILGLIAVLSFYVLNTMLDQNITPQQFDQWTDKAVATLLDSPAAKDVSEADLRAEIVTLMPMAQEEGWVNMEWFLNVHPPSAGDMEGVEATNSVPAVIANRGLSLRDGGSSYIGLGTMMQDATDYLGERQREEYASWKADIMARVEAIETSS
jgi:origin recognition complex subunit 6